MTAHSKQSRDFLLYTKKEVSYVLFYDENMAVTFILLILG